MGGLPFNPAHVVPYFRIGDRPMSYSVRIDKDLCVSAGKCVADEPAVFAFDADELADVRPDAPALSNEALVRLARQCPGRAILLTDESGADVSF